MIADLERIKENSKAILLDNKDVAGVTIAYIHEYNVKGISVGYARPGKELMTDSHFVECASLSKTVAAAFCIEYFAEKGYPMSTSVNKLLKIAGSSWLIRTNPMKAPSIPNDSHNSDSVKASMLDPAWADQITLAMLINHTAMGMHYVYGIPLSDEFPSAEQLLDGTYEEKYGYSPLYLEREPGKEFRYSGGGFIILQHLLECFENENIGDIVRPFLRKCGIEEEFSFDLRLSKEKKVAFGVLAKDREVAPTDGGRLSFPPLAAGGLCTARALGIFLSHLAKAYDGQESPIKQSTAKQMLLSSLIDLGAFEFMRAKAGLGVFVARANENLIMLHQAANDGFRGVYMLCFDGPDKGKGFVIICNGDNPAVYFQSTLAKYLLGPEALNLTGLDFTASNKFDMNGLKQEEIVNLGLKELVLSGFLGNDMQSKL